MSCKIVSRCIAVIALVAQPAIADQTTSCKETDGYDNCNRIVACIGKEGRWFKGQALGRGQGTLAGQINDGTVCMGAWISRNKLGLGQADVVCEDGMDVTVIYTYQHEQSGTAVGRGLANTGEYVKAWSGRHVIEYLNEENGTVEPVLMCGKSEIPIS